MGYSVGAERGDVVAMLPNAAHRLAIGELNGQWIRVEEVQRTQKLAGGDSKRITVERPVWVESVRGRGRTAMAAAFRRAAELVEDWIAEHPDSVPPVVLNISDGGWTGEPPMQAVRALEELPTTLGPTLVFNCQLGVDARRGSGAELLFPSSLPEGYSVRTREMFLLSSVLPESMWKEARDRGIDLREGARGVVFNARVAHLVDFLQIGTQTLVAEPDGRSRRSPHTARETPPNPKRHARQPVLKGRIDDSPPRAPESPPSLLVFLCHSSADKPVVRRLERRLRGDGVETWLDEQALVPGQDWDRVIRGAVRKADIVVVCLSRGSVTRAGYVQKEIRHVLDIADEQPDGAIFVIPARIEECDVPDRLSRWHWVDLYRRGGYKRLLAALREAEGRKQKFSE
jgi:hypothetical protein